MKPILHNGGYAVLLAAMLVFSGCASQTYTVAGEESSPAAMAVPEPVTEEVVAEELCPTAFQ